MCRSRNKTKSGKRSRNLVKIEQVFLPDFGVPYLFALKVYFKGVGFFLNVKFFRRYNMAVRNRHQIPIRSFQKEIAVRKDQLFLLKRQQSL